MTACATAVGSGLEDRHLGDQRSSSGRSDPAPDPPVGGKHFRPGAGPSSGRFRSRRSREKLLAVALLTAAVVLTVVVLAWQWLGDPNPVTASGAAFRAAAGPFPPFTLLEVCPWSL
jgi:hypothetical protein